MQETTYGRHNHKFLFTADMLSANEFRSQRYRLHKNICSTIRVKSIFTTTSPTNLQHGKHALANVEGVTPVVVGDVAIILSNGQQPTNQRLYRRCTINT